VSHPPRILVLAAVLLAAGSVNRAIPPVIVEHWVALSVEPMIVEGDLTRSFGQPVSLEIGPESPGEATLRVPWGPRGEEATVRLGGKLLSGSDGGAAVIRFSASVRVTGQEPSRSERDVEIDGDGTSLLEAYGDEDRRLLLAIRGERVDRPVVLRAAHVGLPVLFSVAIERIDGERTVLLETNQLNTFVGQSVQYSFRRGQDADVESVRLDLLPVSVSGDLVTIQADVSGALPGPKGASLVSHHQRIVASRRATSSLSATAGTPPSGYRFQVTPDF
jgi:hypothetical protein